MTEKLVSILKGAGLAAVGAFLTVVLQSISQTDFGPYAVVVAAALSVAANAIRKFTPELADAIARVVESLRN